MKKAFDQCYDEAVEPGRRERAYAWATTIGLQGVDGLNQFRGNGGFRLEEELLQSV